MKKMVSVLLCGILSITLLGAAPPVKPPVKPPAPLYTRAEIVSVAGVGYLDSGVLTDDPDSLRQLETIVATLRPKKHDNPHKEIANGGQSMDLHLEKADGSMQTVSFFSNQKWASLDGVEQASPEENFDALKKLIKTAPAQNDLLYYRTVDASRNTLSEGFFADRDAVETVRLLLGGLKECKPRYAEDGQPLFASEREGMMLDLHSGDTLSSYMLFPDGACLNSFELRETAFYSTPALYERIQKLLGLDKAAGKAPIK